MTVSETFENWYDRMKSMVTEAAPGERKGAELDSCVRQVMAQGHDRESAYAICNESLKCGLEKDGRYELLDTAKAISDYDEQVPTTYRKLIDYAGLEAKSEEALELPKVCRKCENQTRIKGNFMCPECHPDVDPKADDVELVGSPVQEAGDEGGASEKSGGEPPGETRKVYLDHGLNSSVPDNALVRADEKGLYYEAEVEVSQKEEETVEELIEQFLEDWEGTDGSEPNISDLDEWVGATDRSETDSAVELAGLIDDYQDANPDVDIGEATVQDLTDWVDDDFEVGQKADPMVNGHDLDPETGTGACEATGKEIEAETMKDLTEDCPHCGEGLSVFAEKGGFDVDMKAEFGADVFRVVAAEDDDTEYDGDVLGIGIDFPESGVYVDWRREAFPDELDEPHVSIYGSVEDLEQATRNVIEPMESLETPIDTGDE